ncbi:MAG: pirin family protein [Chloroflexi bacterium]|nr:pirin family protein [Chloroflexota bacterium]
MTVQVRRQKDLHHARGGFFTGDWHFSFDDYEDPENTRFGTLRVFNVDTIIPGGMWPIHPHRFNEVVTYCVAGEFRHGDNLGNTGVLYPGDVQHTSIGSGMWHEEVNNRDDVPMTFIQVWIMPRAPTLPPSVEQRHVEPAERLNRFLLLVSGDRSKDPKALPIQQDAEVYSATVEPGREARLDLRSGYGAYVYCISGRVRIGGDELASGDAAKVYGERAVAVTGVEKAELFVVVVRLDG